MTDAMRNSLTTFKREDYLFLDFLVFLYLLERGLHFSIIAREFVSIFCACGKLTILKSNVLSVVFYGFSTFLGHHFRIFCDAIVDRFLVIL